MMRFRISPLATSVLLLLAIAGTPLRADESKSLPPPAATAVASLPSHGVVGIEEAHLTPEFWIERLQQSDRAQLNRAAIDEQNARLLRLDDSMHDLRALPATLPGAQVAGWIEDLSTRPQNPRFDVEGRPVSDTTLDALVDNLALDAIADQQATRHGLVVHRADLRTFPTALRVFSTPGETDIDRFQESALFPGTPVVIAHESADGDWWFVVSPRYAAWIEKRHVAEGAKDAVFGYVDKTPYRIVTGARERTVFTREQPAVSELQLDMGVRVPLLAEHSAGELVNGQHPYTAHVIELPMRGDDGALRFTPALLPKIADSQAEYLPLTPANVIGQGFKFLGERYGWGHAYNGRDCSGFVSEIYRGMGVQLPRNTRDQAVSPALDHTVFAKPPGGAAREAALADLQVGDLVYIPGHVMMVIGHVDGAPYVIHDTSGGSYIGADGEMKGMGLNGVSVTPLLPLMFNPRERYVDRMTSVVRIRGGATAVTRSP